MILVMAIFTDGRVRIPNILSLYAYLVHCILGKLYLVYWVNCPKSLVFIYLPFILYPEEIVANLLSSYTHPVPFIGRECCPISGHPFATLHPVSCGNLPYHPMPTMYPGSWRGCSLQNVAERFTSVGRNLELATTWRHTLHRNRACIH